MTAAKLRILDQAVRPRRSATLVPLALAAIGLALVVATMGTLIVRSQRSSRARVDAVFTARGATSAGFASTLLSVQSRRQTQIAQRFLGGRVSGGQIELVASALGAQAAALLDAQGRVLVSDPYEPALIGRRIPGVHLQLGAMAAGRVAVSGPISSPLLGAQVKAIAVPFDSPQGRRVLAVAYPVAASTLAEFVRQAIVQPHHAVFLVDGQGNVLVSDPAVRAGTLAAAAPSLAAAVAHASGGQTTVGHERMTFTVAPIAGTSWRLVLAASSSELYAGQSGTAVWVPWLVFGIVALLAVVLCALFAGFLGERSRLANLSSEVLVLASTDPLTGLPNRRQLSDSLTRALAGAERYEQPLSLLMIDLDHFKQINDAHGHDVGDRVLRAVAACLREVLRESDLYGRWGGDEFLAVLVQTPLEGAREAAQRLCDCTAALNLTAFGLDSVSLSVGCAPAAGELQDVLHAADAAMYAGQAGRAGTRRDRADHAAGRRPRRLSRPRIRPRPGRPHRPAHRGPG